METWIIPSTGAAVVLTCPSKLSHRLQGEEASEMINKANIKVSFPVLKLLSAQKPTTPGQEKVIYFYCLFHM